MSLPRLIALPAACLTAAALAAGLAGCTVNHPAGASSSGAITMAASDTRCTLSSTRAESGTSTFTVTNTGSRPTEFELLARDGLTIVAEVENVAPGLTRSLSVQAQPGSYTSLCKPGLAGNGVGRVVFTVTGKTVQLADAVQVKAAAARYVAYVRDQTASLLAETRAFTAAYTAGDDSAARSIYPKARAYYERIEPIAEKFGALDAELDARQADLGAGTTWTGWHRIEKDLWKPAAAQNGGHGYLSLTAAQRSAEARLLLERTEQLLAKVRDPGFTVTADAISNGAIGLLDEVAKTKITGEEEVWSHTDLVDFKANVEGAEVAYHGVRDIAKTKDGALVRTLDARFAELDAQLAKYGSLERGFVSYRSLSGADVKTLSDDVNAVSEPLSQLTATVLK